MGLHPPAHKNVQNPPGQITDWIRVDERLPEHGQRIQGKNEKGNTWFETFDREEPLGRMTHWRNA